MASLKYIADATFQTSSLLIDYTSGGVTLTLAPGGGAKFPSTGDFWVRIDDEIFKVTSRTGDVLSVVGAQDGTSAANHLAGSPVRWVMGVSALNQLRTDQCATGLRSAAALERVGNLYIPTDYPIILRDNGSAFQSIGPVQVLTIPNNADYSWVNQDSATVTADPFGFFMHKVGTGAGLSLMCRVKAIPASPYTIAARMMYSITNQDFVQGGMILRDSGTGRLITFGFIYNSGASGMNFHAEKWNSPTSFSANYFGGPWSFSPTAMHLRIVDDNTNRHFEISSEGVSWYRRFSIGRTDFLTPDQYGFFIETRGSGRVATLRVCSVKEN